jgi:hypothetical protein
MDLLFIPTLEVTIGPSHVSSRRYLTVSSLVRIDRDELSLKSTTCVRGSRRGFWADMNIES